MRLLSDGADHPKSELIDCLYDPAMTDPKAVNVHIATMRGTLRAFGLDIVCVSKKGGSGNDSRFALRRLMANPNV